MSYVNPISETAADTSTPRNPSGQVATVGQQLVLLLQCTPPYYSWCCCYRARYRARCHCRIYREVLQDSAATEHTAIAVLPASTDTAASSLSVHLRVVSSFTGEEIFQPIQIQRQQKIRSLLRQLQHIAYNEHERAILIRLKCNDCILDPERQVMQYHAATEHMGSESEPMILEMIAEPVLLTWEQLLAMPAMRKQAGRGGKVACIKQRQLRDFCFEKNIDGVDLAGSAYNWRLLLKTMLCNRPWRLSLKTPDVIGPGIVGFSFRLLKEIDPNYDAARHVFEINCANGDRWHLHFHQRGNCDRRHLPFEATQP